LFEFFVELFFLSSLFVFCIDGDAMFSALLDLAKNEYTSAQINRQQQIQQIDVGAVK
jgi:hypothetical protein